jgi:nicotinamide riboside kinase
VIIALLGAESTGKSALAHALAQHLQSVGTDAVAVDEYLREWCEQHQRTPHIHEQEHIAATQTQRIAAAAAQHRVVVADTTAVMTAVYSDYVFADTSLYAHALAAQQRIDITLLTGLDMPWQADGIQRDGAHARGPVDALLRRHLSEAQIAYQVVYGLGEQRLQNAMHCIAAPAIFQGATGKNTSKKWAWVCDKCSDPVCEHRLFSQLMAQSDGV